MSLNIEELIEACRRWDEMDARLKRLIGCNPTNSNHYGAILMYNIMIDAETTDEEILEIYAKYVRWKEQIYEYCKNMKYKLTDEEFAKMFSCDVMCGRMTFLHITFDLNCNSDEYYWLLDDYFGDNYFREVIWD